MAVDSAAIGCRPLRLTFSIAQILRSGRSTASIVGALLLANCSDHSKRAVDHLETPVNVYAVTRANDISPVAARAPSRVYVPNVESRDVYVIDPATHRVIDRYPVGGDPQHVVPSWDLKTLWVAGSARGKRYSGSLTAIDPNTGKVVGSARVADAYNLYFTPDGSSAIIVAESRRRLEFRDPHTLRYQGVLDVPGCSGINHADYSPSGGYAIFTCEFSGGLAKVDVVHRKVLGYLRLSQGGMPQDIRISPDGAVFYVANMITDGVLLVDGNRFREIGFIPTGVGAHGLYPSRDGEKLYVSNRGSHKINGAPRGPGSISVIDFTTRRVERTWPIPGGGSPDMGNVSADGKHLWLAGRFDGVVYDIDTDTGRVRSVAVGKSPHGLTVWPQPGRHSLGHTGVMR